MILRSKPYDVNGHFEHEFVVANIGTYEQNYHTQMSKRKTYDAYLHLEDHTSFLNRKDWNDIYRERWEDAIRKITLLYRREKGDKSEVSIEFY